MFSLVDEILQLRNCQSPICVRRAMLLDYIVHNIIPQPCTCHSLFIIRSVKLPYVGSDLRLRNSAVPCYSLIEKSFVNRWSGKKLLQFQTIIIEFRKHFNTHVNSRPFILFDSNVTLLYYILKGLPINLPIYLQIRAINPWWHCSSHHKNNTRLNILNLWCFSKSDRIIYSGRYFLSNNILPSYPHS